MHRCVNASSRERHRVGHRDALVSFQNSFRAVHVFKKFLSFQTFYLRYFKEFKRYFKEFNSFFKQFLSSLIQGGLSKLVSGFSELASSVSKLASSAVSAVSVLWFKRVRIAGLSEASIRFVSREHASIGLELLLPTWLGSPFAA